VGGRQHGHLVHGRQGWLRVPGGASASSDRPRSKRWAAIHSCSSGSWVLTLTAPPVLACKRASAPGSSAWLSAGRHSTRWAPWAWPSSSARSITRSRPCQLRCTSSHSSKARALGAAGPGHARTAHSPAVAPCAPARG
jgi:hypothetical protein